MNKKRELTSLRRRLGEIDVELLDRLEERARVCGSVRALLEGEPVSPDGSETDILRLIEEHASGVMPAESLRRIFLEIAAAGRGIERPSRVSYVGPEGSFCHQLVKSHFGASSTFIECATVADVLEEVSRGRAQFGVFAFDSSVDGLILPAVSALAEKDLVVVAERSVPAILCLMNQSGDAAGVQKVYGTAAAHAACERFLEREFPDVKVLDVRSPVEAAQLAREDGGAAAVCPELCGRDAGLSVAQENIGDEPDLRYRFAIVGTRPASRTGDDTTSLLFSLEDAPGTLYQVLSHFAERGINLKKIQSRPVRGASWDYIFYVEVSGHMTDRSVVTALEAVKGATRYLKVLGSFPTES